jgi:hypothetical protein
MSTRSKAPPENVEKAPPGHFWGSEPAKGHSPRFPGLLAYIQV